MKQRSTSSVLATYATLKSLSDEKKYQSPYQILREFIRYVIVSDALYSFSAIEMKSRLSTHFNFSIPEAVVKTSLKSMAGISLDHGTYSVIVGELGSDSVFEDKKREADDYESCIIQMLSEYITKRSGQDSIDTETLIQELTCFLTEDVTLRPTKYMELIGEFVLKNEHDTEIQEGLNRIRGGSILYMGLCYSIGETGSITKPLTLYLGTEILFSFMGYNGKIFQQFANDFYDQVRTANSRGSTKISLQYFSDTKKEIDEFFGIASDIVDGKKHRLLDKPAMKAITDGCSSAADVDVKKSDFYYLLKHDFGITEDPNDNYYDEEYFSSNLESFEYQDETDKRHKKEMAIRSISHINKLRHGNRYQSDIDSEHLIVTNTKATLLISKEQAERIRAEENLDRICNFAVSLDRITSLLWYKLGNGFSQDAYPSSINAVLKARVVLSSNIAKNAERAFLMVQKDFADGRITEEQVAARIITLRKKPTLPEDLQGDDIDEVMDFSPEYLTRYEEQFKHTQNSLKEKEEIIESIKADNQKVMSKKDATISQQETIIQEKDKENDRLRGELKIYQDKEAEIKRKKDRRKRKLKCVWYIIQRFLLVVVLTAIVIAIQKIFKVTIPPVLSTIIEILGIIGSCHNEIKKAIQKFYSKSGKSSDSDEKNS